MKKKIGVVCAALLLLVIISIWQFPDDKFHIYFLDVGQGDAIFIKTPLNQQILIDGGPGDSVLDELNDVMPFWDRSIDMVILTHPHSDHLEGLVPVLQRYKVKNILLTGVLAEGRDKGTYSEFEKLYQNENAQIFFAEASIDFSFGPVLLDIIYPFSSLKNEEVADINDSSIAIMVSYENHKILLTGDLTSRVEVRLADIDADILKAGHHGSKYSSSPGFLRRVSLKTVVIQSGKDNTFGHPHEETLKNLKDAGITKIRRTDEEGRIEFVY